MENVKSTIKISRTSNIKNISTRISIKVQNAIDSFMADLNEDYGNISILNISEADLNNEVWVECSINNISQELKELLTTTHLKYTTNVNKIYCAFEKYVGISSVKEFEIYSYINKEVLGLSLTTILRSDRLFTNNLNTFLSFKEELKSQSPSTAKYIIKEQNFFHIGNKVFKFNLEEISMIYKFSEGKDILSKTLLRNNFTEEEVNSFLEFLFADCYITKFKTTVLKQPTSNLHTKIIKSEYITNLSDQYDEVSPEFRYFTLIPSKKEVFVFFSNNPKIFNNLLDKNY